VQNIGFDAAEGRRNTGFAPHQPLKISVYCVFYCEKDRRQWRRAFQEHAVEANGYLRAAASARKAPIEDWVQLGH